MHRALTLFLLATLPLSARVVRVEIASRADIAYGYERIEAKVFFAGGPGEARVSRSHHARENRRVEDLARRGE